MANTSSGDSFFGDVSKELVNIHQQARTREIEVDSGGRLPAGIENGIAELRDIKFDRYEEGDMKGKPYFYANGVVVEPEYVVDKQTGQKVRIKGMFTHLKREPLCETPKSEGKRKTFADHWFWMEDRLKELGLKDYLEKLEGKSGPEVEQAIIEGMKLLRKLKPKFRFRTWKAADQEIVKRGGKFYCVQGKKDLGGPYPSEKALKEKHPYAGQESLVNQVWQGAVDFSDSDNTTNNENSGVEDGSPQIDGNNSSAVPTDRPEPPTVDQPAKDYSNIDLPALTEAAIKGETAARDLLEEYAAYCGLSDAEINEAKTWQELVSMIPGQQQTAEATEKKAEAAPEAGQVYNFEPLNGDGKPHVDRCGQPLAIPIEITAVNHTTKTVTAVNRLNRKEAHVDVPWTSLLSNSVTKELNDALKK